MGGTASSASGATPSAEVQSRLVKGEATRLDGEHPRALYTVAVGQHMSCGEESIDASSEVPWHSHWDSEEVLRCTAGTGKIYVGEQEADFLPGVSVLVPKGVPHRILNLSSSDQLWLSWTLSPPLQAQQFQAERNSVTS
ncbi:unnamed protein product [Polarella glacialis]|uniref:Cupin type-2 domain-containing protein n=1 Tax=Polarella glacialis TaxID=89957 RepID=A0A813HNE1_POLGL|nr:unnamed protein product [Polarella glacialis]